MGYGLDKIIIIIANLIIIASLICYLYKKNSMIHDIVKVGMALVIGGGMGNLLDRIFRGYVIDYIDINQWIKYPLFNFADICIVIGVIIIIVFLLKTTISEQEKA